VLPGTSTSSAQVHPDDKNIDKQPSLFQKIMSQMQDENSDDEIEEDKKKEN